MHFIMKMIIMTMIFVMHDNVDEISNDAPIVIPTNGDTDDRNVRPSNKKKDGKIMKAIIQVHLSFFHPLEDLSNNMVNAQSTLHRIRERSKATFSLNRRSRGPLDTLIARKEPGSIRLGTRLPEGSRSGIRWKEKTEGVTLVSSVSVNGGGACGRSQEGCRGRS